MRTLGLRIKPLDVLFFRDGKPFGESSRATSVLPVPQTLAGALRTALLRELGCDFDALDDQLKRGAPFEDSVSSATVGRASWVARMRVRGPWLARETNDGWDVLVPAPATLMKEKGAGEKAYYRLDPLHPSSDLPGWSSTTQSDLRPLWARNARVGKKASGFLTTAGLREFLRGGCPGGDDLVSGEKLFAHDFRTGIGVSQASGAAEESRIYAASFLSLNKGVAWYAEVEVPQDVELPWTRSPGLISWGGEGRQAQVEAGPFHSWPEVDTSRNDGVLFVATSPLFLGGLDRPRVLKEHLVAQAFAGTRPVSGWDLARNGPKPTRFAAEAGSVFFTKHRDAPWPESLTDNPDDALVGWGSYLKGVWNYA